MPEFGHWDLFIVWVNYRKDLSENNLSGNLVHQTRPIFN